MTAVTPTHAHRRALKLVDCGDVKYSKRYQGGPFVWNQGHQPVWPEIRTALIDLMSGGLVEKGVNGVLRLTAPAGHDALARWSL